MTRGLDGRRIWAGLQPEQLNVAVSQSPRHCSRAVITVSPAAVDELVSRDATKNSCAAPIEEMRSAMVGKPFTAYSNWPICPQP